LTKDLRLIVTQVINEQFLQSRRDDPLVKDRERALQSLDLAYFKYCGIIRNLEEGFKVREPPVCALLTHHCLSFSFSSSTMTLLISSVNSKKSAKHGVPSDGKNYCKLLLFASPENRLLMHDQALLRSININPYKSCPLMMMMIPGDSQIHRFHLTTPMSTVDLPVCCRKGHLL